jgi:hypothetical protein
MREIEDDHWSQLDGNDDDPQAGDGKAAETEQKKPRKILVEFKNISFDVRDLGRITRSFESSTRYPSGRASTMVLNMSSHPYEEKFYYENDDERDKDYEMLQMKLADLNIKYELAVPISVQSIFEEDDEEEADPEYEDLTDGLDDIINPD